MVKVKIPTPTKQELELNQHTKRGSRLKRLLAGQSVFFANGGYRADPVFDSDTRDNGKVLTAINITAITRIEKKFTIYDGMPIRETRRRIGPRMKSGTTFFMFDINNGSHSRNTKVSQDIKNFLDEMMEMIIVIG